MGCFFNLDESNYDIEYHTVNVYGVLFNPTMEINFARGMGITGGFYANINTKRLLAGIDLSLQFGKIRGRVNLKPETTVLD